VRNAILDRCRTNLATLRESGIELVRPDGGWSAVLRDPRVAHEEQLALELLALDGVAVHPGYFFDALSLLPPPAIFAEGVRRLVRRVAG
jgi:aspartate/methionine/tyrosine aminotransferase